MLSNVSLIVSQPSSSSFSSLQAHHSEDTYDAQNLRNFDLFFTFFFLAELLTNMAGTNSQKPPLLSVYAAHTSNL